MIVRTNRKRRRPGNVILLVALLLTTLLGMAGYAVDGGMILTQKRTCQATADASAMAAACVFYQNYQKMNSSNLANYRSEAQTAALNVATANGFLNDAGNGNNPTAGTSKVSVNFPPNITNNSIYNNSTASSSYDMNLNDGVVEVVIDYYQSSYFTKVWGFNTIHLTARAVARGNFVSPNNGVIILDYTVGAALTDKGGGNAGGITVTGGNFVVDSNAANAVVDTGGAVITAPEFDITGGTSAPAGGLVTNPTAGQIFTGMHPTPDPFAYLQPYAASTYSNLPRVGAGAVEGSGTASDPYVFETGKTYTSIPNFTGNSIFVKISGSGMIGFDLGDNKNFNATGCTISGQNICIYMNSGQWSCAGTGCVMCGSFNSQGTATGSFTGMNSTPLQGFVFFQPPSNTQDIQVVGNGGFSVTGTVYAPGALIQVGGNGTLQDFGSQYVSRMMKGNGNGNITVNYKGPNAAKTRVLALIE